MDPDLVFDGSAKQWPMFKSAMLKLADSKNLGYMLEGGHGICAIFQAASAAAARATTRSATATATISLDIKTYNKKEIEEEFKKTSVLTSVALAVRQNRKDKLGTSWADASKCGLSETALTEAHKVLDVKYMKEVNRTLDAYCTTLFSRRVRKRMQPAGFDLFSKQSRLPKSLQGSSRWGRSVLLTAMDYAIHADGPS